MAVLYYVAPDSGFTLDVLQCAPGNTALTVRFRLQLHELADLFDFLLGSLVLDFCTIPTCQSGEPALQACACCAELLRHASDCISASI